MSSIKFYPDFSLVSAEIRSQMGRKQISQSHLADRMGVCQATIHNRLNHAAGFTLQELVRASGVLGVSITIANGKITIN